MTHRPKPTNRSSAARAEPHAERVPAGDLANEQQVRTAARHAVQAAIQEGLDSAIGKKPLRRIRAEAEQSDRAGHGMTSARTDTGLLPTPVR